MKKITLLIATFLATITNAQTFSDNFDSYTAGQKLAQQSGGAWTTWSNAPGGAEDAVVSNANAASAPNSVYFSSDVQGGGPVDQVKNFGVLNTGQFSLEMNMFVETGKAAYFNLQKTATIGETWALNANFNDDGSLALDDAVNINLTTNFPHNVWFNFRLDINFNTNVWEVFIDDVLKGSFSNSVNQIASIDIFPVDQNTPYSAGFYIDDFAYTITPYVLPQVNAATTFVSVTGTYLAGNQVSAKVKIRNLGQDPITSFDLTSNYNGIDFTQNFSGQNVASLAETEVTMNQPINLIAGSNVLTATVSNVNGSGNDGDATDNSASKILDPVVPALGKVVVGEEGTGTWCQWCPRGAVYMDLMENTYNDYWAGIAVHNGDPMVVPDYDDAMGNQISGYPSSLVDRGIDDDPSAMEAKFLQRIAVAPTAFINNSATWEPTSRLLTVTVSANFQASANSNYKLLCVLTEDDVTGTTSDYAQANAYAGGANGVMGGYELLPSVVPASQMVYNHVARAISPGWDGMTNSFPATVNSGENHSQTFTFTLDSSWDETKMHIIGMLLAPDGTIDNAGKATFDEALLAASTDITLTCGSSLTIDASSGIVQMPDYMTETTFSTTCSNSTVTLTQSPAPGTQLFGGVYNVVIMATDECGNSQYCYKTLTYTTVGIDEKSNNGSVTIYPNPTSDKLTFTSNTEDIVLVQILSVDGKMIRQLSAVSKVGTVELSDLQDGTYFVRFIDKAQKASTHKIVKE